MNDTKNFPRGQDIRRDLVDELVRIADPGPDIPADGAERVKAAVKPAWRSQVRARSRRRMFLAVAAAAAVAVIASAVFFLGGGTPPFDAVRVATVEVVRGSVEVVSADGATMTLPDEPSLTPILTGSLLRTDAHSRVSLRLGSGPSLRLDHTTSARLTAANRVELDGGAVYVDSQPSNGESLEVLTRLGAVRDVGTQFEVRLFDGPLSVSVREGEVSVTRDNTEIGVRSGTAVRFAADGTVEQGEVDPTSPIWAWVQEVAPPFDIEGRSVVAFLDWVSRETGASIRFSTPEVEAFARETMLHGTSEGLSPAEAPELVLASCGLDFSWEGGSLVVGPTAPASSESSTLDAEF